MEKAIVEPTRSSDSLNIGSLLRLFKSGFFNSWLGVSYLYKYSGNVGVHDYLVNELYNLPDDDMEFYLVQLCNLLLFQNPSSNSLERFLMDKCSYSIHFALKISWIFQTYIEDKSTPKQVHRRCLGLREDCEIATVNCRRPTMARSSSVSENLSQVSHIVNRGHVRTRSTVTPFSSAAEEDDAQIPAETETGEENGEKEIEDGPPEGDEDETNMMINFAISKRERCEYFYKITHFVEELEKVSDRVLALSVSQRQSGLDSEIEKLNESITPGLYLPLWRSSAPHHSIVRIARAKVLKSRERVPYMLEVEILESLEECSAPNLHELTTTYNKMMNQAKKPKPEESAAEDQAQVQKDVEQLVERFKRESLEISNTQQRQEQKEQSKDMESQYSVAMSSEKCSSDESVQAAAAATAERVAKDKARQKSKSRKKGVFEFPVLEEEPFSELWEDKVKKTRAVSPYGHLSTWKLSSVIMKTGDDCRQEQLAVQLLSQFQKIFIEARLPLYLRPYSILVTSATSGIIETVTDTISIHQLKSMTATSDNAYGVTLAQFFRHKYGHPESETYLKAQSNFVESMAAYSLVCFLLQIKDRHNGNILLDAEGHIVHIDFGFMLSNSPGNFGWESSPFKLTEEMVEVMGGLDSPMFYYYKALLLRGFLEVRKYSETVVKLVDMSYCEGSPLSCFAAGTAAISSLKSRFMLGLTEDECVSFIEGLISNSLNNWRTKNYDAYQYFTTGTLY